MALIRSHALFAMMCLVWGTTWIAIKLGVAAVPPVFFAGTRFTDALGSVLARPLLRRHPAILLAGTTTLAGGLVLTAGALALEPGAQAALAGNWGWRAWAAWAFLVLFGSLLAYTAFLRLVRDWGPARAGSYAFVSPVIAVLLGVALLGETVTLTDTLGMAIMLTGAWLTIRPSAPDPASPQETIP